MVFVSAVSVRGLKKACEFRRHMLQGSMIKPEFKKLPHVTEIMPLHLYLQSLNLESLSQKELDSIQKMCTGLPFARTEIPFLMHRGASVLAAVDHSQSPSLVGILAFSGHWLPTLTVVDYLCV